MEGKVKREGKKVKKRRFRAARAPIFWGTSPKKHTQERRNFAPKGLLIKKRNRGQFLAPTS